MALYLFPPSADFTYVGELEVEVDRSSTGDQLSVYDYEVEQDKNLESCKSVVTFIVKTIGFQHCNGFEVHFRVYHLKHYLLIFIELLHRCFLILVTAIMKLAVIAEMDLNAITILHAGRTSFLRGSACYVNGERILRTEDKRVCLLRVEYGEKYWVAGGITILVPRTWPWMF